MSAHENAIEQVIASGDPWTITKNGVPVAVMLRWDMYEALKEKLGIGEPE